MQDPARPGTFIPKVWNPSNAPIGQAKGMLMERYGINANAAFKLLVRLSQESNTPLVDIAGKLVEADHPSDR